MDLLRDGDDVLLVHSGGQEQRVEFRSFLADARGEIHLEYYLFRPDTVTDAVPLSSLRHVRRVAPHTHETEVEPRSERQEVGLSLGGRVIATVRAKSGHLVVDFAQLVDGPGVPLVSLRRALDEAERQMQTLGYGETAPE